jgi:hypothetical protein
MGSFWGEFSVLYAGALLGSAALIPYVARLIRASGKPLKLSPSVLLLLSFVQNALLFAVVVAMGVFAAHAVGRGAPFVVDLLAGRFPAQQAARVLSLAVGLGGLAGLFLLAADLALLPRLPAFLDLARKTSLLENFLASFYGGINEEFLTRLLGVSGIAWLLSSGWRAAGPAATDGMAWSAIVIMAVVFGLGHLPAARAVAGRITSLIVARALILNGAIAVLCGWLFWRFGIEAAVLAHFTADIVYHVGGTALLRASDRFHLLKWIPPPATPRCSE